MVIDKPRNARSHRTVAALLAATRELVDTNGFTALTMAAVADRAGVSRRAIYLHFATRTELVMALYRSLGETESLAQSLQAVWDSADGVSALDEWARHISRSHPRILATLRAIEHARHTDTDAADLWQTTMNNWRRSCRRLITWLAEEGRLASNWPIGKGAEMLWSLMSLDLLERLVVDRRWSTRQFAEYYSTLLRSTFVR